MVGIIGIAFLLIILIIILFIPILIAVYVYRDAQKRGMNALLWMLIALLTPALLGLIIYLLVRNNYSDLTCPNCNTRVEESYVVCPNCRTKLRPTCDVCSNPVQTDWKVCPHCGSELPQYSSDVATPIRKKDKTLQKILIAILLIPIAIILLIVFAFLALRFNGKSDYSYTNDSFVAMTMSEFMEERTETEVAIYNDWFEEKSSNVNGQPYHVFEYESDAQDGTYENQYLIYIPGANAYTGVSYGTETKGFFKKQSYLTFDITGAGNNGEQYIFIFTYEGNIKPPELFLINYNGKEYEIRPDSHTNQPFLPDMINKPGAVAIY